MQSGPRVWLEEKTGGGRRTEPQLPSLSFSISSTPLWPLVAGGRARWTHLHPGHRECLTRLRFYMANRAHPSTASPSNTTGMKRDMYKKEQSHSSISWPASLRKSRWEGRTENLIRAQSVSPSMDKGRPPCRAPRKLAQRQRSQDSAGRMGFLRAKDNEWMPLVARNTKVGAQGRGQKPPAQTPYCLREHDLLPALADGLTVHYRNVLKAPSALLWFSCLISKSLLTVSTGLGLLYCIPYRILVKPYIDIPVLETSNHQQIQILPLSSRHAKTL